MGLANIAEATAGNLAGRFARHIVCALLIVIFALAALYHFTVAGMMALEIHFGALNARLIVGGIYTALTLICAATWWAMARKPATSIPAAEPQPRHMQIAMLIEAVMLGYEMSRKGKKTP